MLLGPHALLPLATAVPRHMLAANNGAMKTCYNCHQSILIGHYEDTVIGIIEKHAVLKLLPRRLRYIGHLLRVNAGNT